MAALAEQWLQDWALEQAMPRPAKVALAMALVLGLFGAFLGILEGTGRKGLSTVHRMSPGGWISRLFVHLAAFTGIYYLYARFLGLWPVV